MEKLKSAESNGEIDTSPLTEAWQGVSNIPISDLPIVLRAFDDATPIGTNWLSAAVDKFLQQAATKNQEVPETMLSDYLLDTSSGWRSRQMALELLRELHDDSAPAIIAKLKRDPSAALRFPAIEQLLSNAKQVSDPDEQASAYREAFDLALAEKHVVEAVVALRKLGHKVDHIRKFGYIMNWQVIGPFDYADGDGFDTAYPPESLDLSNYGGVDGIFSDRQYEANGDGESISWKAYTTTARNGNVDLNKAIGEHLDAVGYGAAIFDSERDQPAELRLRQQNSAKVWVNGDLVFSQAIGHTGNFFDQYIVPVDLKKGPNLILVKSCQWPGPVEHPFFRNWQLSVRVTDQTGDAILSTNRPPTPELDPLPGQRQPAESTDESGSEPDLESKVESTKNTERTSETTADDEASDE